LTQHNGAVYQHKGTNRWKETWLCLETNGKLIWKKKDAYEIKGMIYVDEILNQIQISGWTSKKVSNNNGVTAFLLQLPIEIRGAKSKTTLFLKHGDDLEIWLDAFATVVGRWKLWKACKQRQASKTGKQLQIDEGNVEHLLKYEQLVEFYRLTWMEFLEAYKRKETGENGVANGHHQNGVTSHQNGTTSHHDTHPEVANGDRNGVIARQLYAPNGLSHVQVQVSSSSSYVSSIQTQEKIQVSTVVVHQPSNGAVEKKVTNGEIYGEEDDGEELHF